jgi:thiamine kinase-like enzyme
MINNPRKLIETLQCWTSSVQVEAIEGGITNSNFRVEHANQVFFVRLGKDIPEHGIYRFNELAASQAAYSAGISPKVFHSEPGVLVLDFIDGKTLNAKDLRNAAIIEKVIDLVKTCHLEMPKYLPGSMLVFYVFQVNRGYLSTLWQVKSYSNSQLQGFLDINEHLEKTVGEIELKFGHNDLLAGNFIDDGHKLWLIDWDYAGFNSPLFDLANLASNNEYSQKLERSLLEMYYKKDISQSLWKKYLAMKCASLLRESLWSMVSEVYSTIDFDYLKYTNENLLRFEKTYDNFKLL